MEYQLSQVVDNTGFLSLQDRRVPIHTFQLFLIQYNLLFTFTHTRVERSCFHVLASSRPHHTMHTAHASYAVRGCLYTPTHPCLQVTLAQRIIGSKFHKDAHSMALHSSAKTQGVAECTGRPSKVPLASPPPEPVRFLSFVCCRLFSDAVCTFSASLG